MIIRVVNPFSVLLYHELVRQEDFVSTHGSPIQVRQDYTDVLPPVLFAYVAQFERQMSYLRDNGYTTLRLSDIDAYYAEGRDVGPRSVLLTFDDMYVSVRRYAYPILKRYGFHAVGFVVRDWLFETDHPYSAEESVCMSESTLGEMRDVFEYANHSSALHTRRTPSTTRLSEVGRSEFLADLLRCEELTDSAAAYAYPFGVFTTDTIEWLREQGYRLGFTTAPGANHATTDPFQLHRNVVAREMSLVEFRNLMKSMHGGLS